MLFRSGGRLRRYRQGPQCRPVRRRGEFRRQRPGGRIQADRDWAAGKATIYCAGLYDFSDNLEPSTGLPLQSIAGCTGVHDDVVARLLWHNDRIEKLIARHGAPSYSWLIREPGVCNLIRLWKDRVAHGEQPAPIKRDMKPVKIICGSSRRPREVGRAVYEPAIDGVEVAGIHTIESVVLSEDMMAMGGVRDDKVIYFRASDRIDKVAIYFAVEVGTGCLRYEREKPP